MGVVRFSRPSTPALTLLTRLAPAAATRDASRRRVSTTSTAIDYLAYSEDPHNRIALPTFPAHDAIVRATALLRTTAGASVEIRHALLPFWSLAYTFHCDVLYYLPQRADGSLHQHPLPNHPFLITLQISGDKDPTLSGLQFPIAPTTFLPVGSVSTTLEETPQDSGVNLPVSREADYPSTEMLFGEPIPFSLGPPQSRLVPLYIPSPTAEGRKVFDMFSLEVDRLKTTDKHRPRGLFPNGGSMARVLDNAVGWDRLAFPFRKPTLIAYDSEGKPIAAVDPLTMTLQTATMDHNQLKWRDMTTSLHKWREISQLKTKQFTGAELNASLASRDRLDWESNIIHSMRETVEDQRELESLKRRLDEHLKTRSKSSSIYSIIQQPKITRQAEERRAAQEQSLSERKALAVERQKRLQREAEVTQRLLHESESKKRQRAAAEEKREAQARKFAEAKVAKAKRLEDRAREEDSRRRLEEAMANAARELWGSRVKPKTGAKSKILDPRSYYQVLGLITSERGLNSIPSDAEIKAAWRTKMQVYHPDKPGGSTEMAAKVNTAADALSTGLKRAEYQKNAIWDRAA